MIRNLLITVNAWNYDQKHHCTNCVEVKNSVVWNDSTPTVAVTTGILVMSSPYEYMTTNLAKSFLRYYTTAIIEEFLIWIYDNDICEEYSI